MKVQLDYGKTGLEIELPDQNVMSVLEYPLTQPLAKPEQVVLEKLQRPTGTLPLLELARGRKDCCILICDITRPVPNELILGPMLETLQQAGLRKENILILVATGLHRPNLGDELVEMVGERIAREYRIENHHGKVLEEHEYLGTTENGVPIHLDSRYTRADLKIATGLIEPHFMAGFSGGRKLICPGIAGIETIRAWHSPRFLEHTNARSGCVEGNPVHEENTLIAKKAGCDFIVNVCIDGQRNVTHVCAGDMVKAWEEGVAHCRNHVTVEAQQLADIVVTSSAGYPLDATFYQIVKGMVGALPIVKENGTIVIAASMSEGIGSPEFQNLLEQTDCLSEFLERISTTDFFVMDQWQLEELARAAKKCDIKVVTDGLPAETLDQFFVTPFETVEAAVSASLKTHGQDAKIAVIPKGPYVLATL